jgi:glycosyltransferase involved in cell wall biosynthesis
MTTVCFVVPGLIDDPTRPSGGNLYDRRVSGGLARLGWSVVETEAAGSWPEPDATALALLEAQLAVLPEGSLVMVDGLVASAAAGVLVPLAGRLRLVVLVHMPLGLDRPGADIGLGEAAVLRAARAVIATSAWTSAQLLAWYALGPGSIHVAEPGVDAAEPALGTPNGGRLLCVAAVVPHKGHDVLLGALAQIAEFEWCCTCVGALDIDRVHAERLRRVVSNDGLDHRVQFVGPRTGADLNSLYAAADLLVVASRAETYGMVVTEALARGIPVIATEVGGLPGALGYDPDGQRPGLLVPAGDSAALAAALRRWIGDAVLRQNLRATAGRRREALTDWSVTSERVARVLDRVC